MEPSCLRLRENIRLISDFARGENIRGLSLRDSGKSMESTPGRGKKQAAETLCGTPTSHAADRNMEMGE